MVHSITGERLVCQDDMLLSGDLVALRYFERDEEYFSSCI